MVPFNRGASQGHSGSPPRFWVSQAVGLETKASFPCTSSLPTQCGRTYTHDYIAIDRVAKRSTSKNTGLAVLVNFEPLNLSWTAFLHLFLFLFIRCPFCIIYIFYVFLFVNKEEGRKESIHSSIYHYLYGELPVSTFFNSILKFYWSIVDL